MEGRVVRSVFALQAKALHGVQGAPDIPTWSKQFIDRVLHISHSQWIFRNYSLHDTSSGLLRRLERANLLDEIADLAETDVSEVPSEHRYLLEIDFSAMANATTERQSYWILAMKAPRKAGRRAGTLRGRRGRKALRSRGSKPRRQRKGPRRRPRNINRRSWDADAVDRQIAADHGIAEAPGSKRGRGRGDEILLPANKRRRPD